MALSKCKKLPRTADGKLKDNFPANGVRYYIASGEDGISIHRFNEWQRLSAMVGWGAKFDKIYQNLHKVEELVDGFARSDNGLRDVYLHIEAMKEGIIAASEDRDMLALFQCTLFINRRDEDVTKWDMETARQKIDDWNREGYDVADFFSLAISSIAGFNSVYSGLIERWGAKVEEMGEILTAGGSFPKMETSESTSSES